MKYATEIIIDQPVDKVVQLFDNPDNRFKWMEGLQKCEPMSGNQGHPGAKAKFTFQMGKRKVEMVETILTRDFPDDFTVSYEADQVFNIVKTSFTPLLDEKTRYVTEHEFQFKGFMKVFGFLMPGAFKKQSMKYLKDFKKFAEAHE
jgi:uncharacterized protein YndB with AHSA1/START domain